MAIDAILIESFDTFADELQADRSASSHTPVLLPANLDGQGLFV
jgi:hypothetical protein